MTVTISTKTNELQPDEQLERPDGNTGVAKMDRGESLDKCVSLGCIEDREN